MLKSLNVNRADQESVRIARGIWKKFRTAEDRRQAVDVLTEIFQDEATSWQQQLFPDSEPTEVTVAVEFDQPVADEDLGQYRLDQRIELPIFFDRPEITPAHDSFAPPVDPHKADSAAEGVRL